MGAVSDNGSSTYIGGLVGFDSYSYAIVSNSFWDTETSGQLSSNGGTGKTTNEMKIQSTFVDSGWDFRSTWLICNTVNNGYPALFWQIDPVSPVIITDSVTDLNLESALIQYTISEPGLQNPYQYGV